MDISIFDVIGNGISNKEISDVIIKKLYEKYQIEFVVKMIGDRYGTNTNDTVTTFCYPQNNKNLIFTAILNREQTNLEDDYMLRSVTFELEESIKKEFEKNNIDVFAKIEIIGKNKLNEFLTVQEFIDKFDNFNFLAYIVSKNKISNEVLNDVYKNLENKYPKIYLKSLIYMLEEKGFCECLEIAQVRPTITETIIRNYSVIDEAIMKIVNKQIFRIK